MNRFYNVKKIEIKNNDNSNSKYNLKMVKNTTGGSKTKGQARKFATEKPSNTLRISQDEYELYAQVTKVLGGAMCHVLCIDGITRLCHIRGKFRGRGKRDNFISNGSWILIGLREWATSKEKSSTGKLEACDLMEVYNDHDKDRLKSTVTTVNWCAFIANDNKMSIGTDESGIEFSDEKTEEYRELIEAQVANAKSGISTIISNDGEEIDVDDI